MFLPAGEYEITLTRGPEYLPQTKRIRVPPGKQVHEVQLQLTRWVHLAKLGWYSADHHVHAAGCSHYESPEEGVRPEHMWRQAQGEDLNIACNLTWGPCWYYQKSYFTGKVHPLSNQQNLLRYDVEVSGFPSSHAGHVCLLRLRGGRLSGDQQGGGLANLDAAHSAMGQDSRTPWSAMPIPDGGWNPWSRPIPFPTMSCPSSTA